MTKIVKRLTCDRCGEHVELGLKEDGDFFERYPQGWTTVAYNRKIKDLCPSCSKLHERFLDFEGTDGSDEGSVRSL